MTKKSYFYNVKYTCMRQHQQQQHKLSRKRITLNHIVCKIYKETSSAY